MLSHSVHQPVCLCSCSLTLQCDQMVRLSLQYLAIYNSENLPNIYQIRFKILPITEWICNRYYQRYLKFCQIVEICQIWSHCSLRLCVRSSLLIWLGMSTWFSMFDLGKSSRNQSTVSSPAKNVFVSKTTGSCVKNLFLLHSYPFQKCLPICTV